MELFGLLVLALLAFVAVTYIGAFGLLLIGLALFLQAPWWVWVLALVWMFWGTWREPVRCRCED